LNNPRVLIPNGPAVTSPCFIMNQTYEAKGVAVRGHEAPGYHPLP
jgi:hypothetical protein